MAKDLYYYPIQIIFIYYNLFKKNNKTAINIFNKYQLFFYKYNALIPQKKLNIL